MSCNDQEGKKRPITLTGREQEIVAHLFQGASNQEIADALSLSPMTIRNQISELLYKFQVRNRTQLLARVIDLRRRQHRRIRP